MATAHLEIEIKLSGAGASIDALLADALKENLSVEQRAWRVQTYYDTSDLHLFAHDLELRVRPAKGDYRQTVKRLVSLSEDGVFTREERQSAQSSELPDFKKLKKFLPPSLAAQKAQNLHPLMRTEFARQRFLMRYRAATVECAVDEGQLIFLGGEGELLRPFRMVELELKEGQEKDLRDFSQTLQAHYALKPLRLTKPEMAVQLGYEGGALPRREGRAGVAAKLAKRAAG